MKDIVKNLLIVASISLSLFITGCGDHSPLTGEEMAHMKATEDRLVGIQSTNQPSLTRVFLRLKNGDLILTLAPFYSQGETFYRGKKIQSFGKFGTVRSGNPTGTTMANLISLIDISKIIMPNDSDYAQVAVAFINQ